MSWRLAKSLETLRRQIDDAAPGRNRASDGTVGDSAHAARASDHNPVNGVVHAIDITHDPRAAIDGSEISEALRASADERLKYIIWNRRIWNPSVAKDWRPYSGANPHNKHVHISVRSGTVADDPRPWKWGGANPSNLATPISVRPVIFQGVMGWDDCVAKAKGALIAALERERDFGPLLDGLLRAYQREKGLVPDGKIGAYTWGELLK